MRKRKPIVRKEKNRRRVNQWKPEGYEDWLTLGELSVVLDKDRDYLRRLEREDRLPIPKRVRRGELYVRLYSPLQVTECKEIFSRMKVGRPALS
jgi:hypothetical protein